MIVLLLGILAAAYGLPCSQWGNWTPVPVLGSFNGIEHGSYIKCANRVTLELSFHATIGAGDTTFIRVPVPIGNVGKLPNDPGYMLHNHGLGDCVSLDEGTPRKADLTATAYTTCDNRTGLAPAGSDVLDINIVDGGATGIDFACFLHVTYVDIGGQTCD